MLAWVVAFSVFVVALVLFWRDRRRLRQLEQVLERLLENTPHVPPRRIAGGIYARLEAAVEMLGAEMRQLQENASHERFNLRRLVGGLVEGVIVVDRRGRIQLANEAVQKMFQSARDPEGQTVLEVFREAKVHDVIQRVPATRGPVMDRIELESFEAQGTRVKVVDVNAVPILDEVGTCSGVIAVFHDISQMVHLEKLRKEFVANVSHELRTPLAIFRGYLEPMKEDKELLPQDFRPMVEALARNADRLHQLVEDLFLLTRMDAGNVVMDLQPLDVSVNLQQVIEDWQQVLRRREARLELEVADGLPPIQADPKRFEQIFSNLIDNAVKYSGTHPVVQILADRSPECEGMVRFRVKDSGPGIARHHLPRLFDRFYRVDDARSRALGGTGLGLSIVKELVEAQGGTVRVESDLGRGVCFVIHLPFATKTQHGG